MAYLLACRVAAITGGTTGMGKAITLEYIKQGANIAINHLGLEKDSASFNSLIQEAKEIQANDPKAGQFFDLVGDVTDIETGKKLVAAVVEKWGRLDIMISNAGICTLIPFLKTSPALVASQVNVNYVGAFNTCQAAAAQMSTQSPPGGSIILLASITSLTGGRLLASYAPTKAAVLTLMQSMAAELGPFNIRCNALLPGTIWTPMNDDILQDVNKNKFMASKAAMGRVGLPQEMAGPAVFLGSDMSGYMTGSQLLVDGGMFVNLI